MTDFTIKTRISRKELLLLALFVTFSHNSFKMLTIVGLTALSISIFQILIQKNVSTLLVIGILFLLLPFLILIKANSLYTKSNEFSQEFTCYFNDTHFKIIGMSSIDSIAWTKVVKIINLKKHLIIFTSKHSAKIIATKYLNEAEKKFIIQKVI